MQQTSILEFLNNIPKKNITPIKDLSAITIKDFYKSSIEANLPRKEVIMAWDTLLKTYVDEVDAIFFIRKYGNAPNKHWHLLRRGFLTEFINSRFVYCDNFLAHYFYNMAIEGYVPEYDDFRDTILNLSFPFGHMETKEEIAFRALPLGKPSKINSNGWKLAHIYSVNQKDYSFDYKKAEHSLFTIGEQKDWIKYDNISSRKHNVKLTADEINTIKVHFLRLVHPINYFLVPKAKHHQSDIGNNIGENEALLKFMKNIQLEKFGELFLDYKKSISALDKNDPIVDPGAQIINIKITRAIKKEKKKNTTVQHNALLATKVGEYVKSSLIELSKNNGLKGVEVGNLLNLDYSKKTFNINFPFLIKVGSLENINELRIINGYSRYWKKTFKINGIDYLICKEWYEYNRFFFTDWLNKLN